MIENPSAIRVVLTRSIVESEHLIDAVIFGPNGVKSSFGDIERPVIARSSLKPLQVLPLVSTGAAAAFGFTEEEIALAAASHSAEHMHLDRVEDILDRIGLGVSALECCLLYTSPSPRDATLSRMPSSA